MSAPGRAAHAVAPPVVVLAAHGAGDGSPANAALRALAARLGRRLGLRVEVGFRLGTPPLEATLAALRGAGNASRVVLPAGAGDPRPTPDGRRRAPGAAAAAVLVLPVLAADGYYARWVRAVAAASGLARVAVLAPLGVQPRALRARVRAVRDWVRVAARSGRRVAVLVVGHGTRRSATSGRSTERLAAAARRALARAASPATVAHAFLDQSPRLERVAGALAADLLLVVPNLAGGGAHARRDLAARLAGATATRFEIGGGLLDAAAAVAAVATAVVERACAAVESLPAQVVAIETQVDAPPTPRGAAAARSGS